MVEFDRDAMLQNATAALEMGVEDVKSTDTRRAASAVRNLHAGVLLLLKEVLFRLSPDLISVKLLPEVEEGEVTWKADGKATLDLGELQRRWRSVGLEPVEWARVQQLATHRNDVEHRAPLVSHEALRETVANTFVLVDDIIRRHLDLAPAHLLDADVWEYMSSEAGLHKKLSDECRASRQPLAHQSAGILREALENDLACSDCGSALLRFTDAATYPDTAVNCIACGESWTVGDLVEEWARSEAEAEAYANKGVGDLSWGPCPNCDSEAYSVDEDRCLICEETKPYDRCLRCDNPLSLDEQQLDGFCGYCNHVIDD